jgi:hypothetical protein
MLSAGQLAHYKDEGWLVVDDVISADEVQALRRIVEGGGEGGASLFGINMTTSHPAFLALARDPRITDRIASLIGPNITLQHSKTVQKHEGAGKQLPGGGAVRYHQDFAYFPHTNHDVLAAMLVLDNFTEANGCMRVVPKSHKLGLLDHNTTPDGAFNAEPGVVSGQSKYHHSTQQIPRNSGQHDLAILDVLQGGVPGTAHDRATTTCGRTMRRCPGCNPGQEACPSTTP